MFRKLAIAALAVAGGLFILNSTRLGSYARTAMHRAHVMVKKQVPLEFQIEAVKNDITRLVPEMRDHLGDVAQKTVSVQNLRQDIKDLRVTLDGRREHLRAMNTELRKAGENAYVNLSGQRIAVNRVHDAVVKELASCKNAEKELQAKEKLLEARERELAAEKEQIANIRQVKDQMELEVAQMETELQTLRLAQQSQPNFTFDDSRLARIKDTLKDIQNQLKVETTRSNLVENFDKGLEIQNLKTKAEVNKEVDEYLNDGDITVPQVKK
jgi:chromosome segregation ATPase